MVNSESKLAYIKGMLEAAKEFGETTIQIDEVLNIINSETNSQEKDYVLYSHPFESMEDYLQRVKN